MSNTPSITDYLFWLRGVGGSDLHFQSNREPMARVNGSLQVMEGAAVMSRSDIMGLLDAALTGDVAATFKSKNDVDFTFVTNDGERYRANAFRGQTTVGAVFRALPRALPAFSS